MRWTVRALALLSLAVVPTRGAADDNVAAIKKLVASTGEYAHVDGKNDVYEIDFGAEATDEHLKALVTLAPKKLWKVHLANVGTLSKGEWKSGVTHVGLKELAALPALRYLSVPRGCGNDGLKEIAAYNNLETLTLFWAEISDQGIKHLASAPKLREIELPSSSRASLTDAIWEPLSKVSTLERISAPVKKLTGKGITQLAALKKLSTLELAGTSVSDAIIPDIVQLKTLRALDLHDTSITDDGVAELAGLPKLFRLDLSSTKVTDAGLAHLAKGPKLGRLLLSRTAVTAAGAASLARMDELFELWLDRTKLTDDGLRELTKLAKLQSLYVSTTEVTEAGVKEFKRALPKCNVSR